MTRLVTIRCDKCQAEITQDGSVIEATAGLLRLTLERADLCPSCAGALIAFLRCHEENDHEQGRDHPL